MDAEHGEEPRSDAAPADAPRALDAGQRERLFARIGDRLHRPRALHPVEEVRPRHGHPVSGRTDLVDVDQPVRIVQRQRLQQDAVDHREDCRRRADPERQRRDDRQRERRCLRVGAGRVLEIVPDRFDDHRRFLLAAAAAAKAAGADDDRQRVPPIPPGATGAEFFEQVAADRVAANIVGQRAIEEPPGEPWRHHDAGSLRTPSSPRHIRRRTSRADRSAARPVGVTV